MEVLIMVAQLILGLSILVILHEAGHFFAARMFGIKVEKFYLFFDAWNFSLFKFKYGETEYGIGWLPLGGYVKIAGMVDESLDTDQLKTTPEPWEFRSKPAWQRLIVMIGGVTVNAILAAVIFVGILWSYGEKYLPMASLKNGVATSDLAYALGIRSGDKILAINNQQVNRFEDIYKPETLLSSQITLKINRNDSIFDLMLPKDFAAKLIDADKSLFLLPRLRFSVESVAKGSPAAEGGLKANDSIIAINNQTIAFYDQAQTAIKSNINKTIQVLVFRNGSSTSLNIKVSKDGTIGFYPKIEQLPTESKSYSLFEAIPGGFAMASKTLTDNVKGFGKLFSGDIPVSKSLGGPIAIAKKMYGGIWDWYKFWMTTALLSMVLAFMNLLPIPALDGGHVLFLIIEMIKGGPVSEKVLIRAQYVGMAILLTLMVFVFGNDIWQHILK